MAPKQSESENRLLQEEKDGEKKSQKLELQYNGYAYDVTSFVPKHPGGKIIEMYLKTKADAFHAINQLHFRSIDRVQKIMKTLPKRPIMEKNDTAVFQMTEEQRNRYNALDKDFWQLFNEAKAEGLFEPNIPHIILRFLELIICFLILCKAYVYKSNAEFGFITDLVVTTIFFFVAAIFSGRAGYWAHEMGHNSCTGNPKLDDNLNKFIIGISVGLSSSWWKSQHNRHHAMPNNIKHDVDMKTLPFVAFNKKLIRDPKKQNNFFIRNQQYLFATVDILLVGLSFAFQSIMRSIRKRDILELASLSVRYWMLFYYFGISGFLCYFYFLWAYLFISFALNHSHLPVTTEPVHWVEYSLTHTANVRSGPFGIVDYWMGNLNYQIEHHLMPTMPQYKNKLLSRRMKALAKKHGLQYNLMSFPEALKITFENLGNVAEHLKNE